MNPNAVYYIDGNKYRRVDLEKQLELMVERHRTDVSTSTETSFQEKFDIAARLDVLLAIIKPLTTRYHLCSYQR